MLLESVLQAVSVTILDNWFLIGVVADQVLRRISEIMFLE